VELISKILIYIKCKAFSVTSHGLRVTSIEVCASEPCLNSRDSRQDPKEMTIGMQLVTQKNAKHFSD